MTYFAFLNIYNLITSLNLFASYMALYVDANKIYDKCNEIFDGKKMITRCLKSGTENIVPCVNKKIL